MNTAPHETCYKGPACFDEIQSEEKLLTSLLRRWTFDARRRASTRLGCRVFAKAVLPADHV